MHKDAAIAERVNEALVTWHRWAASGRAVDGYPTECPSCRASRANRRDESQYADAEASAESALAQAVDAVVSRMCDAHRAALAIDARNRATGVHVWVSARLPADKGERARVVADARDALAHALLIAELV